MARKTFFVDIILPLAVPNLYTYRVPFELNEEIAVGKRVVVQFGKGKLYSGLVRFIHENPPKNYTAKYIDSILDDNPIVNVKQFKLWEWMSSYYMCTIGDVMVAALPGGLRLASETKIVLNPDFDVEKLKSDSKFAQSVSDKEYLIIDALEVQNVLTIYEVSKILEQKTVYPLIKGLIEKGVVLIHEELKEKYKPKIETFIRISEHADEEENLKGHFEKLEKKAPKQLDVLMAYIQLSERYSKLVAEKRKAGEKGNIIYKEVKKSAITNRIEGAEAAIKSLEKKNIIEVYQREVGRFAEQEDASKIVNLNAIQQKEYDSIQEQFGWIGGVQSESVQSSKFKVQNASHSELDSESNKEQPSTLNSSTSNLELRNKDVVLLHGVTSSGKTEIYVKLIEKVLAEGKQVLYLLPEIALTTQIINRLRKYFGDKVGVYHSKFNGNERVEVWNSVVASAPTQKGENVENEKASPSGRLEGKLIIGARSALFLPFDNLGLVIVDEEHDTSYKQYSPAPRYNARDAAIYLAHIHGAKTLLGSATPSIESFYNAQEGKFGFSEITERFGGVQMPEIEIADVKEAMRKKLMRSHFAPQLLEEVSQALDKKEQVILFQNRRGFAPQLECNMCAWVPQCNNCDVSLTYHKLSNQLRCHYCGYSIPPPTKCGACGDTNLKMKGFGTEKIEEELTLIYPKANIARMDLDTTRSKFAHQHIIQDFEDRRIDILVGTQMVTKGLDFDNVSIVGILNADSMLNFPDFRSFERSYQLMAQVAGRAGRKNKRGKVIIQTHNPDHQIIQDVIHNNYLAMYTHQLLDRKTFNYPPYCRLIEITLVHRDIDLVNAASKSLADDIKHHFKNRVLGPEFPLVSRVRNLYHKNILLKIERDASVAKVKGVVNNLVVQFKANSSYKAVRVQINVDPM